MNSEEMRVAALRASRLAADLNDDEFGVLADTYPGEEGRWRYGALLKRLGRGEDARAVFQRMLRNAERQPSHYREAQRDWLKLARDGMQA